MRNQAGSSRVRDAGGTRGQAKILDFPRRPECD